MIWKTAVKVIILLILASGIIFSPKGHIDQYINKYVMGPVEASNEQYLKGAFDQAMTGFLVLSGIKSGLAVIEGSEIGVGFNLELGDIVQSVYDYVNIAWKTVLAGATVLFFTQLVLKTVALIDQILLCLTFLSVVLLLVVHWYLPNYGKTFFYVREVFLFLLILTLSLYVILPLTIYGASYASKRISHPLINEVQNNFSDIEHEFSMEELKKELFPETDPESEGWLSKLDVPGNIQRMKERFELFRMHITKKSKQVATWTIKLIAGYIFDCIVFPLSFGVALYIIIKSLLGYLFRNSQRRMYKSDLEEIFQKYVGVTDVKRFPGVKTGE